MTLRIRTRLTLGSVIVALGLTTSPLGLVRLDPMDGAAFANRLGGRAGGFSGAPKGRPSGARTRPSGGGSIKMPSAGRPSTLPAPSRPSVGKPSTGKPSLPVNRPPTSKPVQKPSLPVARPPSTKPGGGVAIPPIANRPEGERPPGARPPGSKPGTRPPSINPPINRPPGVKPPGQGNRPPGSRPPGKPPPSVGHPPGYHPPGHRPPGWRPPPGPPPPYYRPPHHHYGNYYYNNSWGWFFTAAIVGSTIAFATSLPEDQECQEVRDGGETLYECNGVLYRSTFYENEKVYEIVSDAPGEVSAEPQSVFGMALTDPMTRGDLVRDLQNRLVATGYDVGGVDGVFGTGTETALMWFQYDLGIEPVGYVDVATAEALGYDVPEAMKATQAAPPTTAADTEDPPADPAPAAATTEPVPADVDPSPEPTENPEENQEPAD